MKKYRVKFYFHTSVEYEVEADDDEQAIEIANEKECDVRQMLDNLTEDNSPDVEEIK